MGAPEHLANKAAAAPTYKGSARDWATDVLAFLSGDAFERERFFMRLLETHACELRWCLLEHEARLARMAREDAHRATLKLVTPPPAA